jgi:WD40 repeat protein
VSLATLKIIGLNSDVFQNNICCLSFSRTDNGQHLAVVDEAGERNLSVWLWESQTKQASTKCYGDSVFCLEWHPTEANILITAGKQHLITWNVDAVTGMLTRRVGTFEGVVAEKPKYVLTLVFGGTTQTLGDLISGKLFKKFF